MSSDLSGGVDSSSIACLAAAHTDLTAITYIDAAMAEQDDARVRGRDRRRPPGPHPAPGRRPPHRQPALRRTHRPGQRSLHRRPRAQRRRARHPRGAVRPRRRRRQHRASHRLGRRQRPGRPALTCRPVPLRGSRRRPPRRPPVRPRPPCRRPPGPARRRGRRTRQPPEVAGPSRRRRPRLPRSADASRRRGRGPLVRTAECGPLAHPGRPHRSGRVHRRPRAERRPRHGPRCPARASRPGGHGRRAREPRHAQPGPVGAPLLAGQSADADPSSSAHGARPGGARSVLGRSGRGNRQDLQGRSAFGPDARLIIASPAETAVTAPHSARRALRPTAPDCFAEGHVRRRKQASRSSSDMTCPAPPLDVYRYRHTIVPWHEQRRRRTSSTRSPSRSAGRSWCCCGQVSGR
ncbi:asparagine synthase-related protein [Streptomyces anulatus]|uniref:asparagine synthase-related protein n=1 Tax=Streptomyces anulatus TaxID=1892 RepID=UPI00343A7BD1